MADAIVVLPRRSVWLGRLLLYHVSWIFVFAQASEFVPIPVARVTIGIAGIVGGLCDRSFLFSRGETLPKPAPIWLVLINGSFFRKWS